MSHLNGTGQHPLVGQSIFSAVGVFSLIPLKETV